MLNGFKQTYGMRFVGLEDPGSSVYQEYRVPAPEAPYPQDIIIDQAGIVRYWSWEYDPQEIKSVIDALLSGSSVPDWVSSPTTRLILTAPEPNPFQGQMATWFQLPQAGDVRLIVADATGRLVRTLLHDRRSAGGHRVVWNGRDDRGAAVAAGVYYLNLEAGDERLSQRVVLLR